MKHLKTFEFVLTDTKHIKTDKDLTEEEVIDAKYLDVVAHFKIDDDINKFHKELMNLRNEYPSYDGYARKIALAVWVDNCDKI